MDFNFTEKQLLLRKSVSDFLQKECPRSYVNQLEQSGEYPAELWRKVADRGWLGILVPEEYGGSGGDSVDYSIICEELAKSWVSLCVIWGSTACFGSRTIICHGNAEQKRSLLPALSAGKLRFSGAFTEPGGGTDLLAMQTSATKEGNDWILNGQKTFITGALEADYIITIARTNKNSTKRSMAFTLFLVDSKSSGIEIHKLHKLGYWGVDTNEVFFTDVRVPQTYVIGEVDSGFFQLTDTLNNERIGSAAGACGHAQAAFEDALEYAKQRYAFGKPIGQFEIIQSYLAQMKIDIDAARLLTYRAAWMESEGKPCWTEAAIADYFSSETALKCATIGMRIMAGAGYMMENPMQRYYRDSMVAIFAPISNEMCLVELARSMGLPRSY